MVSPSSHALPAVDPPEATAAPPASAWRWPVSVGLLLAGSLLAWGGGVGGAVGALAAAFAMWWGLRGGAAVLAHDTTTTTAEAAGRHGAEVMVAQVVPVWSRQIDLTRDAASDGLAGILQTFSDMSGALGALTQNLDSFAVSAEPGAVDKAVRGESPALDKLTAASQRAFDERDAAVAELGRCADGLVELQQMAKQARELARHAKLVAFNASIEANRQQSQVAGGNQAVAGELRTLSARMAQTGEQMDRAVAALLAGVRQARRQGEISDTSPDELRLEIDLGARAALSALLGALGGALQNSTEVQQASHTLRDQLDAAFVHFQFGDRISQMLSMVSTNMTEFTAWLAANPHATQSDAAQWLAALEASYTMDEQRSSHHGNVVVEHASGVEFF